MTSQSQKGGGLTRWRGSFGALTGFHWFTLLGVFTGLRLVLWWQFAPRGRLPGADLWRALGNGLYADLLVATVLTLPLWLWRGLVPRRWFARYWHRRTFAIAIFLFWTGQVFLLFAEYFFFDEFKSRFNTVAVDYLLYPHEVFVNIWDSYPVAKVTAVCLAFTGGWSWLARRCCGNVWRSIAGPTCAGPEAGAPDDDGGFSEPGSCDRTEPRRAALWPALGCVVFAAVLGAGLAPRLARFSQERVVNEIGGNGAVAFVRAAVTRHLDYAAFYRTLPLDEAYARARKLIAGPNAPFTESGHSIRRQVHGDATAPKLNVVLILVESFGSEFWGSLGRTNGTLTPEMDRLALTEGLLFTNLYASGNRTVRGFEGVLSSFPPLPGDSIVKRHLSENVETIARMLKRDGYETLFLYGGRGLFDGMRSYAIRNGWDQFIEQKNFARPTFTTIWGVCDEDLMARAVEEFRELNRRGPFLGTVLTVSNHKPYTYPAGRIPEDPNERNRNHAVKYTDYALGGFFRAARQEAFWTNTLFAVVADHGARVYGSQSIPIHSYEIPLVIAGPAVVKQPAIVPQPGCSLDVAPTILGLLRRPYQSLCFGRDLLRELPDQGRVLINHNRDIGLYAAERMVVLGLNQTVEYYTGNPKWGDMQPLPTPAATELELEKDTIALFQVADDLYVNRRFRIDAK